METYTSSQGPGDCVRVTKNPTQVAIATPTQWCQWRRVRKTRKLYRAIKEMKRLDWLPNRLD
jgi:hypothetical protein